MALFGKKKEEYPLFPAPPAPASMPSSSPMPSSPTPVDLVVQMRQQGMSNNQIVQALQRANYKSHQIFDAINQADIKGGVDQLPSESLGTMPYPEQPMTFAPPQQRAPQQQQQAHPMQQMQQVSYEEVPSEKIEEIAEAIIEEKWQELIKNVDKIVEWKNKTDSRMTKIEEDFSNLKNNFDELHRSILGKITEYDQGITNVGTEIKALEKVFQKILPTLTENVNELSRITQNVRSKTPSGMNK